MNIIMYDSSSMDGICAAILAGLIMYKDDKSANFVRCANEHDGCTKSSIIKRYRDKIDTIYILGVEVPQIVIDNYLDKVVYIDNHNGRMESLVRNNRPLKSWGAYTHHPNILDLNGKPASSVAICELLWVHLFKDKPMPHIVRVCGRGSVETRSSDELTEFFAFCNVIMDELRQELNGTAWWDIVCEFLPMRHAVRRIHISKIMAILDRAAFGESPVSEEEVDSWYKKVLSTGRKLISEFDSFEMPERYHYD